MKNLPLLLFAFMFCIANQAHSQDAELKEKTIVFQDKLVNAIIDGIDNDFNSYKGARISEGVFASTLKWDKASETSIRYLKDGSRVMKVAYDSVIPPNTAIEFFELHYWETDSRGISYEKRNYRYKGETDFATHTIVEKYFLLKYKEQSVFIRRVIYEDDLTEYFEIDLGKSPIYYNYVIDEAKQINNDRDYINNYTRNALAQFTKSARESFGGFWDIKYDQEITKEGETFWVMPKENKKVVVIVLKAKYNSDDGGFMIRNGKVNGMTIVDDRPVVTLSTDVNGKYTLSKAEYNLQITGDENDVPVYIQYLTPHAYSDVIHVKIKKGSGSRILIAVGR